LNLFTFLGAVALILLRPALAVVGGGIRFVGWLRQRATAARPALPEVPQREPEPAARAEPLEGPGRRLVLIAVSLLVLGGMVRYVFAQDYKCYFTFRTVTGKVLERKIVPGADGHFQPKVRFCYALDDCYVDRWTHDGWDGPRLTRISREEAEALVAPFPPGTDVTVWCNPADPGMGVIKRYTRWYFYPLLIPSLWVLIAQIWWLLRRE
jgi:hypothetical protein